MRAQAPEVGQQVRVTTPASSANLGPGFDTLGLALALYDTVEVEVIAGPPGVAQVEMSGEGAGELPTDERHLLVRAVHRAWGHCGLTVPAVRVRAQNAIPQSRGLGSSAAAIVAGISAAFSLAGLPLAGEAAGEQDSRTGRESARAAHDTALELATEMEGHADNVAASLLGGLVVTWLPGSPGVARAAKLAVHPELRVIAFVPAHKASTEAARGLLPELVPHSDAAFTASRAALMVHALTSAPELLFDATEDRLHQDYREPAFPESLALVRRLRAEGLPAVISGAGPTVLVPWAASGANSAADGNAEFSGNTRVVRSIEQVGFALQSLEIDAAGVQVEHLT